jgi:hypothetical protein
MPSTAQRLRIILPLCVAFGFAVYAVISVTSREAAELAELKHERELRGIFASAFLKCQASLALERRLAKVERGVAELPVAPPK